MKVIDILISLNRSSSIRYQFIAKSIDTPIMGFGDCNLSGDNRLLLHAEYLPAFLYKLLLSEFTLAVGECSQTMGLTTCILCVQNLLCKLCIVCIGLLSTEFLTVNTGLGRPMFWKPPCLLSTPEGHRLLKFSTQK